MIVGEATDFISSGGTVGFLMVESGIAFELNLADAQQKDLTFSAQLLKAAHHIVNPDDPPETSAVPRHIK